MMSRVYSGCYADTLGLVFEIQLLILFYEAFVLKIDI